jgi:RimJ/RimL family protein N-acetyltransferase
VDARFVLVAFGEIAPEVQRHLAGLPSAIDSFLEAHILASRYYRIVVAGEPAGFVSIHESRLMTQFVLDTPYRHFGQSIFVQARRLEEVRSVFVPTCDELYLSHALDDYRQLAKQAYFFTVAASRVVPAPAGFTLRPAEPTDAALIREESGDFFEPVEQRLARDEFFVTLRHGEPVGFGIREVSALYDDVASIGMVTRERFRRQGVGTATIALLIDDSRSRGLRPIAGCWYYNHGSKRTLERAGMYSAARLRKVEY